MFHPRHFRHSLAVKLAGWIVLGTVALFTVFSWMNLRLQRRQAEEMVLQSADRISDVIQRSTQYLMLRNDREALYEVIQTIGNEPGIRRIRIFNEEGRISYSTEHAEVNTLVDKQAEACYVCHSQEAPLTRLDRPDRARIFTDDQQQRVLGLIRPIENTNACSSATCHAHPLEQRILGVIDTDLSLATVDAQLARQMKELIRFTAVALVVLAAGSVAFIWLFVHRPITELREGTQRVAGGDLSYRLPIRSQDELGRMATSFNKMTADLSQAQAELTDWARTLEDRVNEKSRELHSAQSHLVASEKMASLGKLAATVAHEVNNPLAGILTYARLAQKSLRKLPLDDASCTEMDNHLDIVVRESRRCGEIMKNLLTFARQAPSHRESNDLNLLADRALRLVEHQLKLQDVELIRNLSPDLPTIHCDAGQVQQVILALLVNAVEAMPHGGRLTVQTKFHPVDETVQLTVEDNGTGILPEVLPHIFDPFFSTKEGQMRTGLGLAVAHSIAEQHGGRLIASSTPRNSTKLTLTLPQSVPTQEAQSLTAA